VKSQTGAEHQPVDEQDDQRSYGGRGHQDGTVELLVDALKPADSPRAAGEDMAHAQALAETDAVLPPILVHHATMRVIDGMHRLQAAKLRGARMIRARFFDGDEHAAFVMAVKANIAHGLPLSLADRKAASLRIITSHPQWSDRMIADATGLTHKTVGALRRRSTGEVPQSTTRVGRDGRVRPLNSDDGRLRASELLKENPHASTEEVGLAAGISPTTVKDVRKRLRRGDDPVPRRQRTSAPGEQAGQRTTAPSQPRVGAGAAKRADAAARSQGTDQRRLVERLRNDPSIRFTQTGRALLSWLVFGPRTVEEAVESANHVPEHHVGSVAALARQKAQLWQQLAVQLERRVH